MSGKGAGGSVEELPKDGGEREEIEGISPPDTTHDMAIDVCALKLIAAGEQKAQVVQKPLIHQIQPPAHPWALKGCDLEPAAIQRGGPEGNPAAAEAAGGVVEDVALRWGVWHVHLLIVAEDAGRCFNCDETASGRLRIIFGRSASTSCNTKTQY